MKLPQFKDWPNACRPKGPLCLKCRAAGERHADWREAQTGMREFACPFDDGLIAPDAAKAPPARAKFVAPVSADPRNSIPSPPVELPQFKNPNIQCGNNCGVRHKCRNPLYSGWREFQTGKKEFPCPYPIRGLGDVVATVTSAVGVKACGGCKKRQEALNKAVPLNSPGVVESDKPN